MCAQVTSSDDENSKGNTLEVGPFLAKFLIDIFARTKRDESHSGMRFA